ncbi:Sulfotransferase family protein [Meinhardsimonia xiamenensis]|jgi:hypothetical protein|uniref:Sulfotransferase family protein n=1 Tax=Meinhardsimonia xiamenensis TaxID=990712 RepID=A0A1G9E5Y0_9RHOB|nr:sulfotransferase family 2 domain-containing protein [Meinhardsimonia xiamenensis]PRX33914.1 sulfotransferase family protein [Meinhardsimonia xiamenensis]SDK71477.1 Sulfotransferase family protein [Meinhardsimonia xiamenensis]
MIVSHSRRIVFFSFPKTGSETLRSLLAPIGEEPVLPYHSRSRLYPFYPHMPPREAEAVFRARGWDFSAYRRITVVRNPYPRLVSLYRMILEADGLWRLRRRLGLGVPDFERWLVSTRPDGRGGGGRAHQRWRRFGTWSARAWLHDAKGRPLVTDVLRLERLATDLLPLLADLGLAVPAQLPMINARPRVDWRSWYGEMTRALIARRYAWDLQTFYPEERPDELLPRAA